MQYAWSLISIDPATRFICSTSRTHDSFYLQAPAGTVAQQEVATGQTAGEDGWVDIRQDQRHAREQLRLEGRFMVLNQN